MRENTGYIGIITPTLYTKELLDIINELPTDWSNDDTTLKEYRLTLGKALRKLKDYRAVYICEVDDIDPRYIEPLTEMQDRHFNMCIRDINYGEINHAYHELYDCIHNYRYCKEIININEYRAYKLLITQMLRKASVLDLGLELQE